MTSDMKSRAAAASTCMNNRRTNLARGICRSFLFSYMGFWSGCAVGYWIVSLLLRLRRSGGSELKDVAVRGQYPRLVTHRVKPVLFVYVQLLLFHAECLYGHFQMTRIPDCEAEAPRRQRKEP